MSLGDDVRVALPEMRQAAESMMADRASIFRPGDDVFDPNTGLITPSETTVYTGLPCWLRMPTAEESERLFGEEQVTATKYVACFTPDVTGVKISDVVRFTMAADPDALTKSFRVVSVSAKTYLVFRAVGCEVIE